MDCVYRLYIAYVQRRTMRTCLYCIPILIFISSIVIIMWNNNSINNKCATVNVYISSNTGEYATMSSPVLNTTRVYVTRTTMYVTRITDKTSSRTSKEIAALNMCHILDITCIG